MKKTKQEEVREGVWGLIGDMYYEKYGKKMPDTARDNEFFERLFAYLHSKGCVIKVDRGLPDIRFSPSAITVYDRYGKPISHADAARYTQQDMVNAGFTAWEPLV